MDGLRGGDHAGEVGGPQGTQFYYSALLTGQQQVRPPDLNVTQPGTTLIVDDVPWGNPRQVRCDTIKERGPKTVPALVDALRTAARGLRTKAVIRTTVRSMNALAPGRPAPSPPCWSP